MSTTGDSEGSPAAEANIRTPRAPGNGDYEVVVLGGGPGGYTAAFRAADLGKRVALVERYPQLGGVCLNVGCIPSKTLLHIAEVVSAAADLAPHGVHFESPTFDFGKIRAHKDKVVKRLTGGLKQLARQRGVDVIQGTGSFSSPYSLDIEGENGIRTLRFDNAIVAVGSRPVELPDFPNDDPRLVDSTGALEVDASVKRMLVIGGGIIGLEMAAVYDALGARVSIVELLPELMAEADRDLVKPLQKRIEKRYEGIHLGVRVSRIDPLPDTLRVFFDGDGAPEPQDFDRVLVCIGRRPNGDRIGAAHAGLEVDERGFISVDDKQRTNVSNIYAIGDVVGAPMLAHKATHEGVTAAEVIAGLPAASDARAIPGVAYTDPEVAWTGLTEREAKAKGIEVERGLFPWAASGRALSIDRSEGLTKLLFSKEDGRLLGAGIVGPSAGELIAEATLAIELGSNAEDLALTIHPHPTLAETIGFAGEVAAGTITDLYLPKNRPSQRKA
jgi:dihydrolipoamide dehydrogenase